MLPQCGRDRPDLRIEVNHFLPNGRIDVAKWNSERGTEGVFGLPIEQAGSVTPDVHVRVPRSVKRVLEVEVLGDGAGPAEMQASDEVACEQPKEFVHGPELNPTPGHPAHVGRVLRRIGIDGHFNELKSIFDRDHGVGGLVHDRVRQSAVRQAQAVPEFGVPAHRRHRALEDVLRAESDRNKHDQDGLGETFHTSIMSSISKYSQQLLRAHPRRPAIGQPGRSTTPLAPAVTVTPTPDTVRPTLYTSAMSREQLTALMTPTDLKSLEAVPDLIDREVLSVQWMAQLRWDLIRLRGLRQAAIKELVEMKGATWVARTLKISRESVGGGLLYGCGLQFKSV